MLSNSETRWGALSKALHWTIALLVIGTSIFVLHVNDSTWWFKSSPLVFITYIQWHKAIGLIALALIVLRVLWRRSQPVARTAPLTPQEERWSHRVHIALYVLMLAVPITGFLASSFFGSATKFWGMFEIPSPLPKSKIGVAVFYWAHFALAWSLLVLVSGHAGMALYHHFSRRDGVLRGMLPGSTRED